MTNFELYTLIFSGIVTISTIVSLALNYKLTKEATLTRKHKDEPDINIYYKRAEADPSLIFVVIENIGLGYAKKVKFEIIQNFKLYDNPRFDLNDKGIIQNGKDSFAPNQKIEYYLSDFDTNHANKLNESLIIRVFYENIFKEKFCKTFNLELKELLGEMILKPPANYIGRIAHELEEIKSTLKKINEKKSNS